MFATRHQRVPVIALTTQSLPNSPIDKVTEVSCGANGDTVSCLRRRRSLFRFSSLKGSKLQWVPRFPVPSSRHAVRVALTAPGGEILRSPACVASLQLCPGSSGVWLRRAEKTVLGAGGRGVVSSATLRLSVLRSGGKEWFCNRSDITTDLF